MQINLKKDKLLEAQNQALVLFFFSDDKKLAKEIILLDQELDGLITKIFKLKDFKGELAENYFLVPSKKMPFERLILVGLGQKKNFNLEKWVKTVGLTASLLQKKKIKKINFYINNTVSAKNKIENLAKFLVKSVLLAAYKQEKYKTDKKSKSTEIEEISLVDIKAVLQKKVQKAVEEGKIISEAINLTREYNNLPANEVTPKYLVKAAEEIIKEVKGLKLKVLGEKEMAELGMGGILGVSAGSKEEAQFIILEWRGNKKKKDNFIFIGKGITFDSGGVMVKPSEAMKGMHADMAGGGAVLGAMKAIAQLKLPVNITGLIPATENMPSGSAFKTGDILKTMSGKTIEVVHTDAEGRIILADALCYAKKYKPAVVIDLATLTGACMVALGYQASGLMGNNQPLINKIEKIAKLTHDKVWQLPMWPEYKEDIKSEVADVKNLILPNFAGAINGAKFLEFFVDGFPWVHLDIAGPAWLDKPKNGMIAGATGCGVHLLVELARSYVK